MSKDIKLVKWIYDMKVGKTLEKSIEIYERTRQRAWQYGVRFNREYKVRKVSDDFFVIKRIK